MIYEDRGCTFAVVFGAVVAEDVWGEEEEGLNFKRLLLLTLTLHFHISPWRNGRSLFRIFMPLLATRQEVAKKTDFGKPKSQVCLFAKCEHRASHGRKHCAPSRSLLDLPAIAALQS